MDKNSDDHQGKPDFGRPNGKCINVDGYGYLIRKTLKPGDELQVGNGETRTLLKEDFVTLGTAISLTRPDGTIERIAPEDWHAVNLDTDNDGKAK